MWFPFKKTTTRITRELPLTRTIPCPQQTRAWTWHNAGVCFCFFGSLNCRLGQLHPTQSHKCESYCRDLAPMLRLFLFDWMSCYFWFGIWTRCFCNRGSGTPIKSTLQTPERLALVPLGRTVLSLQTTLPLLLPFAFRFQQYQHGTWTLKPPIGKSPP